MAGCVCVCIYGLNAVMSDVTKARRREGRSRAVQDSAKIDFARLREIMVMKKQVQPGVSGDGCDETSGA